MSADPRDDAAAELYVDLLIRTLSRSGFEDPFITRRPVDVPEPGRMPHQRVVTALIKRRMKNVVSYNVRPYDPERRRVGKDWPQHAESMIGVPRLRNVADCTRAVVTDDIPGDLIETGVWRGGAVILMRGVLKAYGDARRRVWAADSFEGLPRPDVAHYPQDAGDRHHLNERLAVSVDEVRANFERYGLLDDQVRFLKGWFKDTLPDAPIEQLSLIRLDGDMYESTMQAIEALYPKLSVGGFLIVDDYGELPAAKAAIHDYRDQMGISDEIVPIDHSGVYWRRSA